MIEAWKMMLGQENGDAVFRAQAVYRSAVTDSVAACRKKLRNKDEVTKVRLHMKLNEMLRGLKKG